MQIHWLTKESVSILTGKSDTGTDIWKVHENSRNGRIALADEQTTEIVAEVMAVWGDTPTIMDDDTSGTYAY